MRDGNQTNKKLLAKFWIQSLIRAFEEDLAKEAPKCENKYCAKIMPNEPKNYGWSQRLMNARNSWLCETCTLAYDSRQFCEFCFQIYLENTAEFSALDGKQWAQCEGNETCGRWAHVDCLGNEYGKTIEEVMEPDFKYICCNCNIVLTKKRKMSLSSYFVNLS